jgi:vanillate O-demethylase ferredoxin subunit
MSTTSLTVRVATRRAEAEGIAVFELADAHDRPLPAFSAGSHIDVEVPGGPVRQYSLCNDPTESHRYLIGVLRVDDSRGGSAGMHDRVREGDTLRISEPRNHFPLAHGARESVLIAGGIGVTPILCMAERLCNAGATFHMHYCTRSQRHTAFHQRIANSRFRDRVDFYFDDRPQDGKFDAASVLANPRPDVHVYVCGPTGFMDYVLASARSNGWNESQLHREYFAAQPQAPSTSASSFKVRLASSGKSVDVRPDQSVVEALAAAGVDIMTSCGEGVCGTCLTRVLEGEPEHRDVYLTDEEHAQNDQFTPCCSRSRSPELVLDL